MLAASRVVTSHSLRVPAPTLPSHLSSLWPGTWGTGAEAFVKCKGPCLHVCPDG